MKYQTNIIYVNIRIQLQQVWDSGVKFGLNSLSTMASFSGAVKRFFYQFGFIYFHHSHLTWVRWLAAVWGSNCSVQEFSPTWEVQDSVVGFIRSCSQNTMAASFGCSPKHSYQLKMIRQH
ncbi:hypothetical protein V8G54_036788 [Vigna mungo]|uniref:Uncharacterized protein n=1 Tax=Vigna mungo TaxID=3915 RepID=A0AAQ3MJ47_VIGMU